jgi:hypothetical protein
MRQFTPRAGTRRAVHILQKPLEDIAAFTGIINALLQQNPLGCTSYRTLKKHHPPVVLVRERYTAKFAYENTHRRQIGTSSEVYDSVEGYQDGIHAVMANMANITAHRGKARHLPGSDHFSAILKCHDAGGELYFLSLARDRIAVASYMDDEIRRKVEQWAAGIPSLA